MAMILILMSFFFGSFTEHTFKSEAGERQYWLYVPTTYSASKPSPLIVMLHGCTQDGPDIARGTRLNEWAEREGFIVVYPQQSAAVQAMKCWNWFNPQHQARDAGEPAIVAGITREIMGKHNVGAHNVFIAGVSAGAAMAGLTAAAYPELYSALALHSGPEFRAASNVGEALQVMKTGGPDPVQQGTYAYQAMATRARAMPVIVFQGAKDVVVSPVNGEQAAKQWISTNDHADDGAANSSLKIETSRGDGHTRTVATAKGRQLIEYWLIDDLGHAWSGGSTDGTYTDPRTQDATAEMIRFFKNVH
jgi:poly(hydroxyalkanoate) depolymerase family esterase